MAGLVAVCDRWETWWSGDCCPPQKRPKVVRPHGADSYPDIGTGPVADRQRRSDSTHHRPRRGALAFVHYEALDYLMTKKVSGSQVTPTLERNLGTVGFSA